MATKRIYKDHVLTQTEKNRRHQDKVASIDAEMDQAFLEINWERRNKASQSLLDFIQTYMISLMIDFPPSENMKNAIRQMDSALNDIRPYNIELPRGEGKTSISEMALLYEVSTGRRKFVVIISQNARSAANILKDLWRPLTDKDTAFSQDFPEICRPFQIANGSFRRRQLYKGVDTEIQKTSTNIQLARMFDKYGNELPTSGSVITVRGITSGVRGLKVGKLRPDCVLLDDLQTAETASNPDQVQKILDIIKKDVFNLSSNGKLAVLNTCTPICTEDLAECLEKDVNWKTTKYPAIISWPKDIVEHGDEGLWGMYFKIFDKENLTDIPHTESLEFYKKNKDAMDEGASVFSPKRFKESDGHISGLQALLEKRHVIGESAFQAEMQMKPQRLSFALDITSQTVLRRIGQKQRDVVPDGFQFVACAIDLNVSHAMTYSIVAFKRDMTAVVIHHGIKKTRIDLKLNDTDYNRKVYDKLAELLRELKSIGIHIDGVGIDAGGRNWQAVCDFCSNSMQLVGIPCCAMAGKASHMFNPYVRSRLRDAIGRTVLCGDSSEHARSGSGQKYMFFDSDVYREIVQKAFLSEVGAQGSCQLYNGTVEEHSEFAIQVTNEHIKFIKHRQDGRDEYFWTSKEPHDYLDTMSMCYAIAASQGLSSRATPHGLRPMKNSCIRKRFRIV